MRSIQEWGDFLAEWAKKDPRGFHIALILTVIPFFIGIALISRKLARMIDAYEQSIRISRTTYLSSKES